MRMTAPMIGFLLTLSAHADAHDTASLDRVVDAYAWNTQWPVVALIALSAALYAVGHRRYVRSAPRRAGHRGRSAAWWAGWTALVVSLLSPLDALGARLFSAHMVQHELMMLVAAPLMVLGRPMSMFAWSVPRSWALRVASSMRHPAWRATWHFLTIPLAAWAIHAMALWIWHAPPLFEAGLAHPAVHDLQHATFFASALLFWWTLVGRRVRADSALYVLTTMLHTGVLGMLLTFATEPWYPSYLSTTLAWGLTPLEDQQLGGLIMWIPSGALLLGIALLLGAQWLEPRRDAVHGVLNEAREP
jgi:putative membrane protein